MVLVDVGQLFRCVGQHFMCVATGPPIRGDPISQSQSHIPLNPPPPALDPFPEAFFFPQYGAAHGHAQEPTPGSAVEHCRFLDTGGGGQHPRVAVASSTSPPKLYAPKHKRRKKFENAEEPAGSTKPSFMNIVCKGGTSSTLAGQQRNTRRWDGWEDMECFFAIIGTQ